MMNNKLDVATLTKEGIEIFEKMWEAVNDRMSIVPGKEILRKLREKNKKFKLS